MKPERSIGLAGCLIAVTLVFAGNAARAEERLAETPSNVLEEFTIPIETPLLPVTLGDKTYSFVLDTGASVSVFDSSLVTLLGNPVRNSKFATLGKQLSVPEFAMPDMKVGRLKPPPDARALCTSLLEARQALDEPLDGMIGMDFLRGYIVQLDYDAKRVRFLKSVPAESGERFPVTLGAKGRFTNTPLFNLTLTDEAAIFMLDTGMGGGVQVSSQVFDELDNRGRIGIRSTMKFATAGGTYNQVSGRLDRFTVGSFNHRNLVVDRHAQVNIIGQEYLKRFVVTFDFPQKVMYLKPGKYFDRYDQWDLSGLHIWRVNGEAVIEAVDPMSPAEALGLRSKDVITHVDRQPAAEVNLTRLRSRLRNAARAVELTVRQGDRTFSVELTPKEFRAKRDAVSDSIRSDSNR